MADHAPDAKITTIDRNPEMIGFAKENFAQFDSRKQITLLERWCCWCFIYFDRNIWFLSLWIRPSQSISSFYLEILKHLEVGGVVVLDDIFQGGDVAKDIMEVRRGQRTIYRGFAKDFSTQLWTIQV